MLSTFEPFIDLIQVESFVTVCRDSKDNFLLALEKDGKADYLLTGDKDLLDLIKFGKTKIKTITAFIDETKNYREQRDPANQDFSGIIKATAGYGRYGPEIQSRLHRYCHCGT